MTVSSILQHTRKGKVRAAHTVCAGKAEIIEIEAMQHAAIIGQTIQDLDLPSGVEVGAVVREGKIIIPDETTIIVEKDRILILALTTQVNKVDKIFSERLDYY